jgi:hypothetical protein
MFKDAFKSWFGRKDDGQSLPSIARASPSPASRTPLPEPFVRHSLGMEQFFGNIEARESLRVLDLSGASQANINFMLRYGHHLYCEDLMSTMRGVFGDGDDFYTRQADDELASRFLSQTFANLQGSFDGALVWDCLQFLQSPLLDYVVGHLHRLMEPGALLFAFFPSNDRLKSIVESSYRIESNSTMKVMPRIRRPLPAVHTSRSLERLFSDFSSVKFFLTRDHYRELIVRR